MMLLIQCAWEAVVAVVSLALEGGGKCGGGGDSSRSPSKPWLLPGDFSGLLHQTRDHPSALWLLSAHNCSDASARVLLGGAKK